MSSPSLSVVMPTYDAADYIERSLESILHQSFDDFELIIVDDGSTDGTIDLIEKRDDERIRLVERENESGITSALNRGINESHGKYIARHDADDWSAPERFDRQVTYLDTHSDVALLGTGAHLVDEDGKRIAKRRVLEDPEVGDLINHNEFIHGSVMMRRDPPTDLGGYDERFMTAEDYDLWLRLADQYSVANIDEPLYYFRQHDESIYGSNLKMLKLYHVLATRRVKDGFDKELYAAITTDDPKRAIEMFTTEERTWFHTELARESIRYGNLSSGREHVREAIRLNPTDLTLPAMLLLTYTTPKIASVVVDTYRKVINAKISVANRSG
ncbi:glycosyltransferase [Halorubrum distributum]|uniref:Glycosyltransferase n=1 Tax=Halorubrum distributum TaxID=29283 RepID=A0A6B1IHX9_9EURY|nr:glycosyltransferase [Halorubrum terrestre]MYL66718.1 glycosyltransferase [Halorubrum terrestre]